MHARRYLSVFDWHLLWFVQYPDIISFSLVAIGVIGGIFLALYYTVMNLISTDILSGKPRWRLLVTLVILYLIFLGFQIYVEHLQPEPHYLHIVFGWTAGLAAM